LYQFSRAIYRDLSRRVLPSPVHPGRGRRQLLDACERTVERLANDPRYFAQPAQSLFSEVRQLFPLRDQLGVYQVIDVRIGQALDFLADEVHRGGAANLLRCRATTRKGRPCQRLPLRGSRYCPSHKPLEHRSGTAAA
jgi:hypothetical protein